MAEKRPERCSLDFHGVLGNDSILALQKLSHSISEQKYLNIAGLPGLISPILSPERYYNLLSQSKQNIITDVRHLEIIAALAGAIPGGQLLARVLPEPLHLITGMPESSGEALKRKSL